jgi:formylaminopyrimidine deformylase / aminopyrimidine aminohydrolase
MTCGHHGSDEALVAAVGVRSPKLERTYLESWEGARPGAEPYREFVESWTTDEFRSYVGDLQAVVDHQLEASVVEQAPGC